jgi:hypothetical protein
MKLYYVVTKQLDDVDGFEETTGWKTITVYDIDTQAMDLVVVTELEIANSINSEERISQKLDLLEYSNYELVQL